MCKLLCESLNETYSGPGCYLKKWQRQHLLDTQSRSSLVGLSNFERWCSSLLVCLSLPSSRPSYYPLCNIYNVKLLHNLRFRVYMHKMCQNITFIIFYVTHPIKFWANEMGDTNFGFLQPYKESTVFAIEISLLPSPQQPFTKSTTTAFLSWSQSKINQYIKQYESQQLIIT